MESPAERERRFEARVTRLHANCDAVKGEWATPNAADGWWQETAKRSKHENFVGGYIPTAKTPFSSPIDRALAFYNDK